MSRTPSSALLRRCCAAALLCATTAGAQTPIGDAVIPRNQLDSYNNYYVVSGWDMPAPLIGSQLLSVTAYGGATVFSGSNVGLLFTPVIVAMPAIAGGNFTIVGIGTERAVQSGVVNYDFGLTAGSNLLGAGMRFGWFNNGMGAIAYNLFDGDGIQFAFSFLSAGAPGLNNVVPVDVQSPQDRAYSITYNVATPTTVVPEPGTLALVALSLVGLVAVRRGGRQRVT